jgi:hypothetical protein
LRYVLGILCCICEWIAQAQRERQLLRDFDFQVLNPENPLVTSHRSMFVIRDIWMRVTERAAVIFRRKDIG